MFLVNGENINSQLGMHSTHFSHLAHDSHPSFSHLWHFGVLQISFDGSSRHGIHGMQGTHLMHSIQSSHPSHASSNPWTKAKLQRQNKVHYKILFSFKWFNKDLKACKIVLPTNAIIVSNIIYDVVTYKFVLKREWLLL